MHSRNMNRRNPFPRALVSGFLLAIIATSAGSAAAQAYPAKPIRLVVPFPPGGGADRVVRVLTKKLEETMGATFVIDNRGGANGNIALDLMAKATPDGYTLALTLTDHLALNPALFDKLSYDPSSDFVPVVLIASYPFVIAAESKSGPASLQAAISASKAAPDRINIGYPSANARIAIEQLTKAADIKMTVVPYRGIAQGMPDLLGGRINFWIGTSATLRPHIDGGKVRGVAVTSDQRLSALPNIPTVAELGFQNFKTTSWYGVLAPAKTPKNVIDLLNSKINAALKSPEVQTAFEEDGGTLLGGTPEEFAATIKADTKALGVVAKGLGLKGN